MRKWVQRLMVLVSAVLILSIAYAAIFERVVTDYDQAPQPIRKEVPAYCTVSPALTASSDDNYGGLYFVRVQVIVGKKGHAFNARVLESDATKEMEKAALKAAGNWRFIPAKKDGHAVNVKFVIPFRFSAY